MARTYASLRRQLKPGMTAYCFGKWPVVIASPWRCQFRGLWLCDVTETEDNRVWNRPASDRELFPEPVEMSVTERWDVVFEESWRREKLGADEASQGNAIYGRCQMALWLERAENTDNSQA